MYTISILNSQGKEIETINLDETVFNDKLSSSPIYPVICAYRASQRKGLASTKTRGEVSGGGRKPWKQKGTGRARVGSTRSPLWRHGGVIFGPHPRDFSFPIPKKLKNLALRYALSSKVKDKKVIVIEALEFDNPKTKEFAMLLKGLNISRADKNVLLLMDKIHEGLKQVLSNLNFMTAMSVKDVNTYQVMAARKVLLTKEALKNLTNRLKG
jgi:large subunit ribosomal protein L4